MNESQSIDEVLSTFLAVCMNNYQNVLEASVEDDERKRDLSAEPLIKSKADAKATIEAMVREILGYKIDNWKDVGGKTAFKNIPMTYHNASKFRTGYNAAIDEAHLRASKYNLKLEKE